MTRRRLALAVMCGLAAAGCSKDPREALATINVPYSADAFVAQAKEGDDAAVDLFLKSKMSPDTRDAFGTTPLIAAARGGHLAVVKSLLGKDADPNLKDPEELTALAAAAAQGHSDVVKALLDKGADIQADKPVGQLPLIRAIRAGHHDIAKLLLEKGAHPYVQDDQWSPLILASFLGHADTVDVLIEKKADVNARNSRGMTGLMHGAARGHATVVKTLLAHGADINAQDAGGHTALMFAANNGQAECVTLLLDGRADVTKKNRAGSTASSLAAANGYGDIVALIKDPASDRPMASPAAAPKTPRSPRAALIFPDEEQMFAAAAAAAWRYADSHYRPATGLIDATNGYPYTTIWDVGSGLAALYSSRELGLISAAKYDTRIRRVLGTLATVNLYDNAAFNKVYSTATGAMTGADERPSNRGYGWSAIDVGRLLVWLDIISENQPQYRDAASRVAGRVSMNRIVAGGYLQGEDLDGSGAQQRYQEGRIGYEQYAAQGFAAWNATPQKALTFRENGAPVSVMGHQLVGDLRGGDRITSDPLILMGLEFGWDQATENLAVAFLAAQETRYNKTGRVTLASEDAISRPPFFFYYYCALTNGKDFGLDVQHQGAVVDEPRWVSAKAAFAWHALRPSAYTELAVRTVAPARTAGGWGSGVYEATGASTGTLNINTAAVILEAALVHARGGPIRPMNRGQ